MIASDTMLLSGGIPSSKMLGSGIGNNGSGLTCCCVVRSMRSANKLLGFGGNAGLGSALAKDGFGGRGGGVPDPDARVDKSAARA